MTCSKYGMLMSKLYEHVMPSLCLTTVSRELIAAQGHDFAFWFDTLGWFIISNLLLLDLDLCSIKWIQHEWKWKSRTNTSSFPMSQRPSPLLFSFPSVVHCFTFQLLSSAFLAKHHYLYFLIMILLFLCLYAQFPLFVMRDTSLFCYKHGVVVLAPFCSYVQLK